MRYVIAAALILVLSGALFAEDAPSLKDESAPLLKDETAQVSYSIGYQMGSDFMKQKVELNTEALIKGLDDGLKGTQPLMTEKEMHDTLINLKKKIMAAQQAEMKEKAAKNLAEGQAFLAENAKKEGVVSLPSGLQYKVIEEGTGASPKPEDTVTVHYRGTLIDGTEFDSSYSRNEPATFRADQVILGWTEALQLMKEGSKWQLFLPAQLAYGERQAGRLIGPNSTLIFEVELISVDKAEEGESEAEPATEPEK